MKHVVSFSGGKDSTAMLLLLLEKGYPVDEIIAFDGGWEFPQMYEHWRKVEEYTGRKITVVRPSKPFTYWMLEHPVVARKGEKKGQVHRYGNGWPSPLRRWCTRLKLNALHKGRKDCVWYVGLALDEQARVERQKNANNKRFPLVEWGMTEDDCLEYCYSRGFDWGGLYEHFKRVSCFCCPLQRIGELRTVRKHFPELWAKMLEWDIPNNRGFRGLQTVHDLEELFSLEDRQMKLL